MEFLKWLFNLQKCRECGKRLGYRAKKRVYQFHPFCGTKRLLKAMAK